MLKENQYNFQRLPRYRVRATGCKIWSQVSRLAYKAIHEGSGELKRASIYMVWMTISWEACEIDTMSYTFDHHQRLWYLEQKLRSMAKSQDEIQTMIGDFMRLLCLIPTMTFAWDERQSQDWVARCWTDSKVEIRRTGSFQLFLFSSLLFSLLLYFFGSQPGTNGVGRDF